MELMWIVNLMLIWIPVIAADNSAEFCTDKEKDTRECVNFKISKLKVGEYPVNSTSLTNLCINNAGLKEMDYDVFHSMDKLQIIDLIDNLIESLDYRLFLNLTSLHYLHLSRNKLHRLSDGRLFQDQRDLVYLDLSINRLVFLNSSVLEPLRKLKNFNLSENYFDCNCELWKTIVWCNNKPLETKAFCETPYSVAWSMWLNSESKNKCPFQSPLTDPNTLLLIACITFIAIFIAVCIALAMVYIYCRNRLKRKRGPNKINVTLNSNVARRLGKVTLNVEMTNFARKSYLSVIAEGTECSSGAPSSYQLDVDTGSVVFEELNKSEPAMFEVESTSKYVNYPPQNDTTDKKANSEEVSSVTEKFPPSEEAEKVSQNAANSTEINSDTTFPSRLSIENHLFSGSQRIINVTPVTIPDNQNSGTPSKFPTECPIYSIPNMEKISYIQMNTVERNVALPSTLTVENPIYSELEMGIIQFKEESITQQNISSSSRQSVENLLYVRSGNPEYSNQRIESKHLETPTDQENINFPSRLSVINPLYSTLDAVGIGISERTDSDTRSRSPAENIYSEPDVTVKSSCENRASAEITIKSGISAKNSIYSDQLQ